MLNYNELSPSEKLVFLQRMLDTQKLSFDYYSEEGNELLRSGKLFSDEAYIVKNKLEELEKELNADFFAKEDED